MGTNTLDLTLSALYGNFGYMLSRRPSGQVSFTHLKTVLVSRSIRQALFRGELVGERSVMFLIAVMIECANTNEFAKLCNALRLMDKTKFTCDLDGMIAPLLRLGLMERPGHGLFVVTNEGEYFLRDLETMFSRITKNTVRSKWRKMTPEDKRVKYVRVPRVAGSKVVGIPVDDRQKAKRGLPTVKRNGKPRNIKGYSSPPLDPGNVSGLSIDPA